MRLSKSETRTAPRSCRLGRLVITVVLGDVVRGGDFRTHLLTATVRGVVPVANRIQVGSMRNMKQKLKANLGIHVQVFEDLGPNTGGLCNGSNKYIFLGAAMVGRHYWRFVQLSDTANKF